MVDAVMTRAEAQAFQDAMEAVDALVAWAVHERSRPYPHHVIARPTTVALGRRHDWPRVLVGSTVDEVRRQIPHRLLPMPARPDDTASLVETWS